MHVNVLGIKAALSNVLCRSRHDIDSLNLACLDYICSSKLFSGLLQRQHIVGNVDKCVCVWGGGGRYGNEVARVKIAIVCSRLGQHKLKREKTREEKRERNADGVLFFFLYPI